MFDIGIQELIMIFVVALIVVGPKRLPELGRSLGKGLAELKKSFDGVKAQVISEMEMTPIEEKRQFDQHAPSPGHRIRRLRRKTATQDDNEQTQKEGHAG